MKNEELGIRNEGGGFAANIYGAMPENSIQVTSHSVLIPAFKLVMAAFSRIVIPSAAEGSFLHCGQYRIGTVWKQRLGATYFSTFTQPLFIGLQGRFLAYARNDDTGV